VKPLAQTQIPVKPLAQSPIPLNPLAQKSVTPPVPSAKDVKFEVIDDTPNVEVLASPEPKVVVPPAEKPVFVKPKVVVPSVEKPTSHAKHGEQDE
jgi:hypothetical protein